MKHFYITPLLHTPHTSNTKLPSSSHLSTKLRKMMKQAALFSFSLFFLIFSSTIAISPAPAAAPKSPAKTPPTTPKATAPSPKPLVSTLPQSPDSSDSTPDDITKILRKAKIFSVLIRLLKTTEIMNNINSQLITGKNGGITILAPDDSAFSHLKAGFLNSLNENQKIELCQFHILPQYVSSSNFDSLSNPVQTVAGKDPARLPLNVNALGNSIVNISTGVVNASIVGVVYSDRNLAIYHVDKVLLPLDFFLKAKAPALAPSLSAKAPKAAKDNSSADDEDQTNQDKDNKSGAVRLVRTTLMSLMVAFVAVAMMWS